MRKFPGTLFGSDVYTHYTALYTWQSNQMAHAMMGVAGTTLLISGVLKLGGEAWYGVAFILIPLFKDLTDYLVDIKSTGGVFKLSSRHRSELKRDGVTDFLFWASGSALALFLALSVTGNTWYLYATFFATLLLVVAAIYGFGISFIEQKRLYDCSGLPYYFRLPSYIGQLRGAYTIPLHGPLKSTSPVREVEKFVYRQGGRAQHLVLCGSLDSHKTTLAAAIGSGLIARNETVRYLSMIQLLGELASSNSTNKRKSLRITYHSDADIVIVDDLTQSHFMNKVPVHLANKDTVWIVTRRNPKCVKNWITVLRRGLNGRMVAVRLTGSKPRTSTQPGLVATICAWITLLLALTAVLGPMVLILCPIDF